MRNRLQPFSGVVPVFPLPTTVFFPGVLLPLHIFEPRYRAMVLDAQGGEGLIAIATLLPGWEKDYEESPAFHPMATVGRLGQVVELGGGRSNITLTGLERVRLEEDSSGLIYRMARAEVVPEPPLDENDPARVESKLRLLVSYAYLLQIVRGLDAPISLSGAAITYESAVHTLCQNLDVPVASKLRALEARDVKARAILAQGWLIEKLDEALRERGMPRLAGDGSERN